MVMKRWSEADVVKTRAKVASSTAKVAKKARKVAAPADKKPSKYHNERVQVDNIWWDSRREADYYQRLKLEKAAHKVSFFIIKPKFHLPHGILYIADFLVVRDDPLVMGSTVQVVDVKGLETEVFKLKKKLMREQGIEILLA